jgi:hypothetical protein
LIQSPASGLMIQQRTATGATASGASVTMVACANHALAKDRDEGRQIHRERYPQERRRRWIAVTNDALRSRAGRHRGERRQRPVEPDGRTSTAGAQQASGMAGATNSPATAMSKASAANDRPQPGSASALTAA